MTRQGVFVFEKGQSRRASGTSASEELSLVEGPRLGGGAKAGEYLSNRAAKSAVLSGTPWSQKLRGEREMVIL